MKEKLVKLFTLAFVIIQIEGRAQQCELYGNASDAETGDRLIGVNLIVYPDSLLKKSSVAGAASDAKGNYAIKNLKPGAYWLAASFIGYEKDIQKIILISPSSRTEKNIKLKRTKIEIEQVLIEAKRDTNVPISQISISPEFIEQLPTMSGELDLFKALIMLPGVATASELSGGLYVRGGSPDQTLTLVDGVVTYNPFHLGGFTSTFNSDAVSDIKLLKGGFPAEYGGRVSSVLDIKLKSGNKERFKTKLGVGIINSRISIDGPLSEKSTIILSGRKMYLNSLQTLFMKDQNIPFYGFYDLNGKISLRADDKNHFTFSGYFGNDNLNAPPVASGDVDYHIAWGNIFAHIAWLYVPTEDKYTRFSFNYTNYSFETLIQDKSPYAFRQDFFSNSTIEDFSVKGDGQYLSTDEHTVKAGVEITLHKFNLLNNDFFSSLLKKDERIGNEIIGIESAAYLQDEWVPSPIFTLNYGIRLYTFPRARYLKPEPRISLSYALSDRIFLKAAYAEGNQFLHLVVRNDVVLPTDMWFPSTPKIKPTFASQSILGFEWNSDDKEYQISIEGYYKNLKNLFEYSDTSTFSFEGDIENQLTDGNGFAYGTEFFFQKRLGAVTGWIGYTYAITKRKFNSINNGNEFYPRYDKRHDLSFVLSYKISKEWDAGITWVYGTGQAFTMPSGIYYFPGVLSGSKQTVQVFLDYTEINNYRLSAYHKLDVSVNYNLQFMGNPSKISFSIFNAYNRANPLARYILFKLGNSANEVTPTMQQFSLFPFLPTINFSTEF